MKRIPPYFFLLTALFMQSAHGMFTRAATRPTRTMATRPTNITSYTQKRSIMDPSELKNLYTELTPEAQEFSPVHGASFYKPLRNIHIYGLENPATNQLTRELINVQGPQVLPTRNKSKAAYFLTPQLLGSVIGALKTDKLRDPQTRQNLIAQWRAEATMSGNKLSQTKVAELLDLIETSYTQDPKNASSVLLSFLYAKAENKADMINYLNSMNMYMPVFKNNSASYQKAMLSENYSTDDIRAFNQKLKQCNNANDVFSCISTHGYEQAIATFTSPLTTHSPYPPQVLQSSYGFADQSARPNCGETAFNDLFNILLYDQTNNSFSTSLLPSNLRLNSDFKAFYEQSSPETVNNKQVGQAFMNLVSGHSSVSYYDNKNYELSGEGENNLLALSNHFFGLNVTNLDDLGKALSDERRTVKFDRQDKSSIIMTIKNNKTGDEQKAQLNFTSGHVHLKVADRNKVTNTDFNINNRLASGYNTNPQARSLYHLKASPDMLQNIPSGADITMYYALNTEDPNEKVKVIKHILEEDKNNQQAVNYAVNLIATLPNNEHFVKEACIAILTSDISSTNEQLRKYIVEHAKAALKEAVDQNSLDMVNKIFTLLPEDSFENSQLARNGLFYACIGRKVDIIKELCNNITHDDFKLNNEKFKKNSLLVYTIISHRNHTPQENNNLLQTINVLLDYGANVNDTDDSSGFQNTKGYTPLLAAADRGYDFLIETLIQHGADPNQRIPVSIGSNLVKRNLTALELAVSYGDIKTVLMLLKHGANLLQKDDFGRTVIEQAKDPVFKKRLLMENQLSAHTNQPSIWYTLKNKFTNLWSAKE